MVYFYQSAKKHTVAEEPLFASKSSLYNKHILIYVLTKSIVFKIKQKKI